MNKKRQEEIHILDIFHAIRKYSRIVILFTIIGLVIGIILSIAAYLRGEMTKKYMIRTSIAVTSQTQDGLFSGQSINPDSTDIHLAEDMVNSVIYVIHSDRTLNAAVDKLELIGISAKDIYDNMELEQYKSTQIIDITLYWRNAEEGVRILEAINKVCPEVLTDILKIGDVSVVNDPVSKYIIGGSVKASIWLEALLIGLLAGMAVAVILHIAFPTILHKEDIPDALGQNFIGEIAKDKHFTGKIVEDADHKDKALLNSYITTTRILSSMMKQAGSKIHFVTSTKRGEGKTTILANTGNQLAKMGYKTLLVDMNIESPALGKIFLEDVPYEKSLNAVFKGEMTVREAIIPIAGNLDILTAFHEAKDISLSRDLLDAIKEAAYVYDFVLLDSAAISTAPDILSLTRISDQVIFVIQRDNVTIREIKDALECIRKTDQEILGCILGA